MIPVPRGRKEDARSRLHDADIRVNGCLSDRLQRERERLIEKEHEHKERLSAIAGFRKTEIIPIGKLQTALDETDSESEQLSDSEGTAGAREPRNSAMEQPGQFDSSVDWNNPPELSQQGDTPPVEDLDADVEDFDGDGEEYSHSTDPEEGSDSRFEESYQSNQPVAI